MADFGFVGPSYTAASIYQDDQELINWYVEYDPNKKPGERGEYTLYPTPGLILRCTPAVAEVRGLRPSPDGSVLLAIVGGTLYSVSEDYVATAVGNLGSTSGQVRITDNGIAAYFCDGPNRYSYIFSSGTFALISATDGPFQGGVMADVVDNFIVYNRPNSQQCGATSALSTVSLPLSFASKDGAPDMLAALIVSNRLVYLLGDLSSEVWIDIGAFPFPFQRIPGTSTQHGCVAWASVSPLGDSFAFLSRDRRGQGLVLIATNYTFVQISTHALTNDIKDDYIADAIAFTYQIEGHEFYVLTFPTADKTWVYDLAASGAKGIPIWHKWLSVDAFNVYHRHRANCTAQFQGRTIVGDFENGKLYEVSNTTYTDDGATIRRMRRCPHLVTDFNQESFYKLQLAFQPGVGLNLGQGDDPQAMLRWSNDGGETWSSDHWNSIGRIGKYRNRVIWRRLGIARDRIYEVSVSDPIKAVIVSAELEGEVGDN